MTRFICSVAALMLVATAGAQTTSGKIVYDETIKMEIKLQGEDAERFKDLLRKERKSKKVLHFNTESSVYMAEKKADEDINQEIEGGGMVRVRVGTGDDKVFCDLKNNQRIEAKEFMGRKFLVTGDLASKEWKMTGNQKTILNFPCMEAVKQDSLNKVSVWFTPSIPVSSGPNSFVGLPGMVLSVNVNDGRFVTEAVSVEPGAVDTDALVKPKEGKKISQEEYKKIVDEKMKEMQMETGVSGGGGQMIIKMESR